MANFGVETTRVRKKPKLLSVQDLYELHKAEQKKKQDAAERNKDSNTNTPKGTNDGGNNSNTITPPGENATRRLDGVFDGSLN